MFIYVTCESKLITVQEILLITKRKFKKDKFCVHKNSYPMNFSLLSPCCIIVLTFYTCCYSVVLENVPLKFGQRNSSLLYIW